MWCSFCTRSKTADRLLQPVCSRRFPIFAADQGVPGQPLCALLPGTYGSPIARGTRGWPKIIGRKRQSLNNLRKGRIDQKRYAPRLDVKAL